MEKVVGTDIHQRAVDCAHAHGLEAFARLCGDRPYFPVGQMRDGLAQMRAALAQGESLTEAAPRIGRDLRADWRLFDEFNARNATAVYRELEWE